MFRGWMDDDYFKVLFFMLGTTSNWFWDYVRLVGFNWNEFILNVYGLCFFLPEPFLRPQADEFA